MNIACDQCQSKFTIPDGKIPAGKVATLKCPKCQNPISVEGPSDKATEPSAPAFYSGTGADPIDDKSFSLLDEDTQTALICEQDPAIREQIKSVLEAMDYRITEALDPRNALKFMRYHIYDLVVVNEVFGTQDPNANGVLIYLERQEMSVRRNIFVTLLTTRLYTLDRMMAFNRSVNLIVNLENVSEIDKIINRGLKENDAFYRVFRETMKKVGRI